MEPIPGVRLFFFLNPGIAFSVPIPAWAFYAAAIPVLVVIIWLLRSAVLQRRTTTAAGLLAILGGALSNVADRLLYGGVIDYFQIGPLPVVNLADLMIVAGVGLLVFQMREMPPPLDTSVV